MNNYKSDPTANTALGNVMREQRRRDRLPGCGANILRRLPSPRSPANMRRRGYGSCGNGWSRIDVKMLIGDHLRSVDFFDILRSCERSSFVL